MISKKKLLLIFSLLCCINSSNAMVYIPKDKVVLPQDMQGMDLHFQKYPSRFVLSDGKGMEYMIKPENTEKDLRGIQDDELLYRLGIAWKFNYDGFEYIALRNPSKEVERAINFSGSLVIIDMNPELISVGINSMPAGSKLVVTHLDGDELAIRIDPILAGGGWGAAILRALFGPKEGETTTQKADPVKSWTIQVFFDKTQEEADSVVSEDTSYSSSSSFKEHRLGESRKAYERRQRANDRGDWQDDGGY